jgi:hypothetical protein
LSDVEIIGYYLRNNISRDDIKKRDKRINDIVKIIVENEKNAEEYSNSNVNISDECNIDNCDYSKCDPMKKDTCSSEAGMDIKPIQKSSSLDTVMEGARTGRASRGTVMKDARTGRTGRASRGTKMEGDRTGRASRGTAMKDAITGRTGRASRGTDIMDAELTTKKRKSNVLGGAIKLKENKKLILGKERCIYTKKGSKKEYIKYKNEYLDIKEFIKLKSIEKPATTKKTPDTTKKTPDTTKKTPDTTKKTPDTTKNTPATTKKTPDTTKKTPATTKKTPDTTKKTPATTKKTPATTKKTPDTTKKTPNVKDKSRK